MASSSLLLYALKHLAAEAFFYQTHHGEEKLRSAFTYILLHRAACMSCFAKRVPKILLKEGVAILAVSIKIVTVQGGTETGVQSSINLNVY